MPKNISKIENRKSYSLFLVGLILAVFIYGGLTVYKLSRDNQTLTKKQQALEFKVSGLESQVGENQKTIADNESKISTLSDNLNQNNQQLSFYKKTVTDLQQKAASTAATPAPLATTALAVKPVVKVKTVTKKVYVKEKPAIEASVAIQNIGSYKVDLKANDSAFDILLRAANENKINLEYQQYDFGAFVTTIGSIKPTGNQYWSFYYNGKYSDVGASDQPVSASDTTFWELASF